MKSSNKLSRVAKRDKHQRFSIRKFNVGVASVAIAAFWMVSGTAVAADSLDITPETAGEASALVEGATEENAAADAEEEPASLVAEETPVVAETEADAPAQEQAEVEEAEAEVEAGAELKEEAEVETEAQEAEVAEESQPAKKEAEESKAVAPAEEVAAPVTRTAKVSYQVLYIDEETGVTEFSRNYTASEETTAASEELQSLNVSVNLEVPAGFVAVSAADAQGQELAIVNNAIAAAVVEKDSSSRIYVAVRKDAVTANNNDKEGYTALRAGEESSSTGIIQEPAGAKSSDYAISGAWEFSNQLPSEKDEANWVSKQTDWNAIYGTATSVIPRENSTPVTVTVTVSDLENQTENANRVQIQEASKNQASYGGESKHFTLMDDPSAVLALDIRVRPNRLTADQNPNDKFNFDGEVESGYLTITFSEPVTDPIIDLSGVGGNVLGAGTDAGQRFYRGSFNSTVWEYLGSEALELSEGAENLQINGNRIEVIDRNTTANVADGMVTLNDKTSGKEVGAIGTSAGTGSVKIVGTVTELKFKLHHQAIPISAFAHLEGANQLLLRNDGVGGTDGINGLDRDMNDDGHNFRYFLSDNSPGQLPNINADLQRFSLRLPTGWVTIDYVDTEGNKLQDTYTDTSKGTSASVGIGYNTQEDTEERPDEITTPEGKVFRRVEAGDYTVGTVGENGELTDLKKTDADLGTDPVTGEVVLGQKRITYVYEELKGDVVVRYHAVDENGAVIARDIAEEVQDTDLTSAGTDYKTEDHKLPEITLEDGRVFKLVDGSNPHAYTDGELAEDDDAETTIGGDEEGKVTAEKTTVVNYYYEEVKGDVVVRYHAVDENGTVIARDIAEEVQDTDLTSAGTDYKTEDHKLPEITLEDGRVFKLVDGSNPHAYTDGELAEDDDAETTIGGGEEGKVTAEKTTVVNYYYEEVKGNVVVNYFAVDADGNVIEFPATETSEATKELAPSAVDTEPSSNGTDYNTEEDNKPAYITGPDGKVYELVEDLTDGFTEDENGEITEENPGERGKVEAGKTKNINYYYREVPANVEVNYFTVDENGNKVDTLSGETSTPDQTVAETEADLDDEGNANTGVEQGKDYDTAKDLRPDYIKSDKDGKMYQLTNKAGDRENVYTDGDDETGVTAVTRNEDGTIDDTKEVNYYYEEVPSHVVVNYYAVDDKGNVIKDENGEPVVLAAQEVDTENAAQGTDYNTAEDLRPTTIADADGNIWQLVSVNNTNPHAYTDGDDETGQTAVSYKVDADGNYVLDENGNKIVEDTKVVNYYYEKVKTNVNVHYHVVDENGEVIDTLAGTTTGSDKYIVEADEVDTKDADQGTEYNTAEDLRPDTIVRAEEQEDGTTKNVTYKRIDINGTNPKLGEDKTGYTDGDAEDGVTEAIVVKDEDGVVVKDEDGNDVVDNTKDVHYYYERISGDVEVHYHIVDAEGNYVTKDADNMVELLTDEEINEQYDATEVKKDYIVVDGKVYDLVTEETSKRPYTDGDDETGKVAEGTKVVNYNYIERPTNVNVHYFAVDKDGNVIEPISGVTTGIEKAEVAADEVEVQDGVELKEVAQGKKYDTTDLRPDTIKTADGVTYKRVDLPREDGTVNPHAYTDGDDETGKTEVTVNEDGTLDDTKDVNYYYERISGNVEVHYHIVDAEGNVLTEDAIEKRDVATDEEIDVDYSTVAERDPYITVDGKVYVLVTEETSAHPYTDGDDEEATVEEGTKVVNYYYVEVPANVVVNYIAVDDEGNVLEIKIAEPAEDTVKAAQGTDYNTAEDLKPTTIVDANGEVWQLVSVKGTNPHAETDGDDEVGTTSVTVDEDGNVIDTKVVNYYYEKVKANVNVHYHVVDENGNVIDTLGGVASGIDKYKVNETEEDTVEADQGTDYDTTDLRPETIVKDGVTYKRVDLNGTNPKAYTDGDDESGQATVEVVKDEDGNDVVDDTKDVHYYYERISGGVEVHYHIVNAAGEVLTKDAIAPVVDEADKDIATLYNTEDQKAPYIVVDGKIYDLVTEETSARPYTDGDDEDGKITEGTKVVNYYYVERPTAVNVHYYAVDKDGNVIEFEDGSKLADSQTVKDGVAQGEDYDTTGEDTKPDTIVKDGVTYKRVDINGTNPHEATDGDAETGKTEAVVNEDGTITDTKDVNYYYERISGNVYVHYYAVDENGEVVEFTDGNPLKVDATDTEDADIDVDYNTAEDLRPDYITRDIVEEDGTTDTRTYKRVDINGTNPHAYTDGDAEEGKVAEGDKDVNYYYEHIIGNVHVRYYAVDEAGNVIEFEDGAYLADEVHDTLEAEIGEDYDTTDYRPDTIVKDGVTYKRVDLGRVDSDEVNPHAYTDGDDEAGQVAEKDKVINYYYEKVTGNVVVHYVDTEGNVIAADVVDTEAANIGEDYNTEDKKPATITAEDGTVYYLTAKETSDVVDGKVVEGTTHVTYVYEKGGDVVVNYIAVDKDGNPLDIKIKEQARDTAEFTKPGTAYDTSDLKEQIIVDEDGNTWRLVSLAGTNPHAETDGADENGEVKAGETLEVNYYYELVTGDVVVSYVDEEGNQIAKNAVDTPKDTPTGKAYNTDEDLKPESITAADGTVYYLTEKETSDRSANPIGSVVEGTTYVEYVYAKAGSVVVNYIGVDENGDIVEVIADQATDTKDAKAGTAYDTTDLKPEEITDAEGRTWRLVSVAGTNPHAETDGDDETGSVVSGETKAINYYYELVTGDVIVHYVDTEGNVIAEDAVDTEKGTATGTEYNTDEDLKPESITAADGTVYYLTAKETSEDSAPTTGEVVEGTTEITYVYEKAGNVVVHYHIVDENGNVITANAIDSAVDTENGKPGSAYDTTDLRPAEITVDGVTYVLVADRTDGADETGSVEAGQTKEVNYYYVAKPAPTEEPTEVPTETPTEEPTEVPTETPTEEPTEAPTETPTVQTGSVEVHYHIVDKDGKVITADAIDFVVDTKDGKAGEAYDTTDHKPAEITVDGVTYVLVAELTKDAETGSVVAGATQVVNYYYVVKETTPVAPEEPVAPSKPVVVGEELSDEDKAKAIESINLPEGSTAEVTSPVKFDENGKPVVEVTITDENGNSTTVEVPVEAVVTPEEATAPATIVTVGDELTNADKAKVIENITLPEGSTAEVTSPVKINADGVAVVEVTITDENGNSTTVEVPVEAVVTPEEATAPATIVTVGDELTNADKAKVIENITLPEGSTAEVTSPVKINADGVAVVEVTITDANGNKAVVEVPVEAVTVLAPAAPTSTPVTVGSELTEENAQDIIGRITLPTGSTAEVTSPVKVNADGVAVVEVTITDANGNTVVVEVAVDAVVTPVEAVSPTTPVIVGDVLTPANADAVIASVKVPEGSTAEVTSPVLVDEDGNAYVEVTVTDAAGNTIVVKAPVAVATEPTTVWVTEDGKVLQVRQDGSLEPSAFEGYELVRTEVDEDGNITYIFRPAGGAFADEQPTTIWITEDGKVLRAREDGSLEKSAFDGYEFVRTEIDADGNITHIFRPVAKAGDKAEQTATAGVGSTTRRSGQATSPKYVTKDTAQLPNTGEENNSVALTGLGLIFATAGLIGRRRRKED